MQLFYIHTKRYSMWKSDSLSLFCWLLCLDHFDVNHFFYKDLDQLEGKYLSIFNLSFFPLLFLHSL